MGYLGRNIENLEYMDVDLHWAFFILNQLRPLGELDGICRAGKGRIPEIGSCFNGDTKTFGYPHVHTAKHLARSINTETSFPESRTLAYTIITSKPHKIGCLLVLNMLFAHSSVSLFLLLKVDSLEVILSHKYLYIDDLSSMKQWLICIFIILTNCRRPITCCTKQKPN